ncbi:acetate CoA-transferase subunit alpha [Fusibacter ferrireducens]|uniref:Acetate CoA-transferase subunit alpha n=1 Tax=Fusibacter ferrireducens TaxID=2785058 RepID=A0ABR9ZY94_9FIRM|nr:acetate CoA-transferase subunit alpha [Fusibacter ferrireducens]MBF4694549.1 acetate CoA-transferase subunit alpha [Fusibacter ferrireducens]
MEKIITLEEAVSKINDGMTVMIGGFLGTGSPDLLVDKIIEKGIKNLTVVANDTSFPDQNIGKLVVERNVSKVIVSHIGTNPETGRQMNAGELDVVLVPQGTLAEQVRAGGAGLGGILTPTGLGTIVEEGKEKVVVDGETFILEKPIKADVAIIRASKVDRKGNCVFDKSARNFNPLMAMAAETVIVEADEIVEVGSIDPDRVMTPHIFVSYIVKGAK